MPVKIRLMRIGAKKRPFYRVVAVDGRKKRTGGYLELLGTYNPLTEPKEVNLKQDRIDEWVKKGAVLSDGFLRVIGKAVQKPPRKPKKESKQARLPDLSADRQDGQVIAAEGEPRSEERGNSEQKNPENPDKTEDHKNLEPEEKSQADDLSKTEESSNIETSEPS